MSEFFSLLESGNLTQIRAALKENPGQAGLRAPDGASAIQWLTYRRRRDLVDILLEFDPEIDLATACTIGVDIGRPDDPNAMSADGFRPIALAVAFGHNELVRRLLSMGADPEAPSTALGGVAPIHAAVFGRNLEGLKLLIEAGADIDARQQGGFTALMGAAQHGDLPMVEFLVGRGADTSLKTNEGKSAADWAEDDNVRKLVS